MDSKEQKNKQILEAIKELAKVSNKTVPQVVEVIEKAMRAKEEERDQARQRALTKDAITKLVVLIGNDPQDCEATEKHLMQRFMNLTPLEGIQSLVARRN